MGIGLFNQTYVVGDVVNFKRYVMYIEEHLWQRVLFASHTRDEKCIIALLNEKFQNDTRVYWKEFAISVLAHLSMASKELHFLRDGPIDDSPGVGVQLYCGRWVSLRQLVGENLDLVQRNWLLECFAREPVVTENRHVEFIKEIEIFYKTGVMPERELIRLARVNPILFTEDYEGKPDTKGQTRREKRYLANQKKEKAKLRQNRIKK